MSARIRSAIILDNGTPEGEIVGGCDENQENTPAESDIVMEPIRTRARRLGSLFTFYSPTSLDHGEPATTRNTVSPSKTGALDGVRWRMVLVAGAVVGVIPQLLLPLLVFGYALALYLLASVLGLSGEEIDSQAKQFGPVMGLWGLRD